MEYNETLLQARKIVIDLINKHGSMKAAVREANVNAYTMKNLADGSACSVTDEALRKLGVDVSTKIDRMIGHELHDLLVKKFESRANACAECGISHTQLSAIKKGRIPQYSVRKRIEKIVFPAGETESSAPNIRKIAWV